MSLKALYPSIKDKFNIKVIIWDNSEEKQKDEQFDSIKDLNFEYVCANGNLGLAKAYNYAIYVAKNNNIKWLITTDQDSELTKEYFDNISPTFMHVIDKDVVAVVPKILNKKGKVYSPAHHKSLFSEKVFEIDEYGIFDDISTINCCSMLSVDFLHEINNYNEFFDLDMLDIWLYRKIRDAGKNVYVTQATIFHDFACDGKISNSRKKSIMKSKACYIKIFESLSVRIKYAYILFKESVYCLIKRKHFKESLKSFIEFIFMSRRSCKKRMEMHTLDNHTRTML